MCMSDDCGCGVYTDFNSRPLSLSLPLTPSDSYHSKLLTRAAHVVLRSMHRTIFFALESATPPP